MINVRLPYPPTVNNYYAVVRGRKILSAKGRQYKVDAAVELLRQSAPRNLTGRLEVLIDLYPPDRRKRDIDGPVKACLDALQDYGLFVDDSQIDDLRIRRRERGGFVRVMVSEL
jgi:crossover junction endodeoxyribonuclease RusA